MPPVATFEVQCIYSDRHMQMFHGKTALVERPATFMFFGQDRFRNVYRGDLGILKIFKEDDDTLTYVFRKPHERKFSLPLRKL